MRTKTTLKGDIGTTQVIADLVKKGYVMLTPVVSESLPFDVVAYKDGIFRRIQCKYSASGHASAITAWSNKSGNHTKKYDDSDFDYYGVYLPDIDKVVYPSIKFKGAKITTKVTNSATPFYWWEDFIEFTDVAKKRTYKDFGVTLTSSTKGKDLEEKRKVDRPSKEELKKLLWEIPTQRLAEKYGVSDVAISKWAKSYGIDKPPRGYWAKKAAEKIYQV
jgi:transposase-like protein